MGILSSTISFSTTCLHHYTKPVLLDVVLGFKSELAQILYTHLDLIMARRDHYERRTKELFEDLGLEGESYKHPSKRRQALLNPLKELKGVRLTTGMITTATLERTKDDSDFKLIVRKSVRVGLPIAAHLHVCIHVPARQHRIRNRKHRWSPTNSPARQKNWSRIFTNASTMSRPAIRIPRPSIKPSR